MERGSRRPGARSTTAAWPSAGSYRVTLTAGNCFGVSAPVAATVSVPPPAAPQKTAEAGNGAGKKTFDAVCTACHSTGVAGAPKFGDKAAWAPRIAKAYNDAFVNNWEYYPLTEREIKFVVDNILMVADHRAAAQCGKADVAALARAGDAVATGIRMGSEIDIAAFGGRAVMTGYPLRRRIATVDREAARAALPRPDAEHARRCGPPGASSPPAAGGSTPAPRLRYASPGCRWARRRAAPRVG